LEKIIPGKIMVFSALMFRLAFLSRVAFLCNISLVLAWLLRYLPVMHPPHAGYFLNALVEIGVGSLVGMILVLGLGLCFLINPVVNIWYAVVLIRRKPLHTLVPVWLAIANFIFLILQLYMII
jgi:hypothetical protein